MEVSVRPPKPKSQEGVKRFVTRDELFEHAKHMSEVIDGISLGARYDYNSRLENYFEELEAHLNSDAYYESLVVDVLLVLENSGTCPAEDTDIFIEFPEGTKVIDEDDLPKRVDRPEPPERPVRGKKYEPCPLKLDEARFGNWAGLIPHGNRPIPNVRGPAVDASGRHVKFNIGKVKQKTQIALGPLLAVFDSAEGAKSFSFHYRILSDKVPDEVTGKLSVVLKRVDWHEPSVGLEQASAVILASISPVILGSAPGRGLSYRADSSPPRTNSLRMRLTVAVQTKTASATSASLRFLSAPRSDNNNIRALARTLAESRPELIIFSRCERCSALK